MNKAFSAATAAAALLLAGCASFSPDGGFTRVAELTRERTGHDPQWQRGASEADTVRTRVNEILAKPLSADGAVEVALLNNRGLQARFAELGMAESDVVRAGRLPNPRLGFVHLSGGGVTEIDRSVMFNLLGLLTMPLAQQVEQQRFEQTQLRAALDAVGIAAAARQAYFNAVTARQLVTYYEQVHEAADVASELARRMEEIGNFSRLARMREQAFQVEATAQLARARQQALSQRERLVRTLGLSGDQLAFTLPERLPDLPKEPLRSEDAEQTAIERRLDVLMARRATEATASALGLTQATRMVNVLEVGYANKSQTGEPRENGYQIELELPLFDFGAARTARAEALYMQSLHRTAEVAVNAQSEVREAYGAYRSAYELARHYRDEVVPLRQRISDENLLRYNGMLIDVFELLADSREQVRSVTDYIEALRDHWVADSRLRTALTGGSPGDVPASTTPEAAH
ncbi:MAG TPA: TolC family protein [Burkholderiaceae bacterium]|nr:TolC family protein [Burkholderiaceae bacterium]